MSCVALCDIFLQCLHLVITCILVISSETLFWQIFWFWWTWFYSLMLMILHQLNIKSGFSRETELIGDYVHIYMETYTFIGIYIHIYIICTCTYITCMCEVILWGIDWLMGLGRLTCPQICSQPATDPGRPQGFGSQNASRLKTLKEPMFPFEFEGRKIKHNMSAQYSQAKWVFSYSVNFFLLCRLSTDWLRPSHGGGQPNFLRLLIQMFISSKPSLTDTFIIVFDQMSGHPVAESSWDIKLIVTLIIHLSYFQYWNATQIFYARFLIPKKRLQT